MLGIISDIHGNDVALQAVLKRLDELNVTKIICLGDICGYYCQVNECCEMLQERAIPSLMGNHDYYIVSGERCPRSTSANRCLDYQRNIITSENLHWLKSLKPRGIFEKVSVVHGGWNDPIDEYLVPSSAYFSDIQGELFASGHTHVPCLWSDDRKTYCNPGSVGQPRDGDPRASFAILNEEKFTIHRQEYDIVLIQKKMQEEGFEEYFYSNLNVGSRIGGKIDYVSC